MSALTPTQIKTLCAAYNLKPSRRYGQHYLISDAPVRKMIEAAQLSKKETVIEIGPGFGVLTMPLAQNAKQVIALEIEQHLKPYWEEKMRVEQNIEIVWGNAVHLWEKITQNIKTPYMVVANLPYQITSHIIREILTAKHKPDAAILMVQKEVAERICAKPGDMSLLSVSVQYYGTPNMITQAPKGAFWPSPKVDSAVIAIKNIQNRPEETEFFRVVKAAFASRRKQAAKQLADTLGIPIQEVKKALTNVTGRPDIRAEELSIPQWQQIVLYLLPQSTA